jgi:energy-coupling factor transport system permease protein
MLGNITIGQYVGGDSVLHRSDPRTKIIAAILMMAVIFILTDILSYIIFAFLLLFMILVSRIPIKYTLKGLKPIFFLIIFTVIINLFTVKGVVAVDLGFASITNEGIYTAARLALRLILLVISASLLTLTTTPINLTDGIERLLKPLSKIGFPGHELALMMTIALRFIPTLVEETDKIMKAQKSRGADLESGNIIKRAKSFLPVLVPLFVNSFKRADDLAIAMEARGYRGGKGRTRLKELHFSSADLNLSSFLIITMTCMIVFDKLLIR